MVALLARAHFVQRFHVLGGGVQPEIPVGSRVSVWRFHPNIVPVVVEKGPLAALCMDAVVVPAASNAWETISAANVATNRHLAQGAPNKVAAIWAITDKTDTWLFRSREGGHGILQILGQSDNPRGVKIRYKPVQSRR